MTWLSPDVQSRSILISVSRFSKSTLQMTTVAFLPDKLPIQSKYFPSIHSPVDKQRMDNVDVMSLLGDLS
ncbi:MAG: hypothetical protein V7K54_04205 [Nostoc sp.]